MSKSINWLSLPDALWCKIFQYDETYHKVYKNLLLDGSQFGINISYKIQPSPDGLAQAFILGEEFIEDQDVALVLGDNIFYGSGFSDILKRSVDYVKNEGKAKIFGYSVKDPGRYGVVDFDSDGKVLSIEEKPEKPKSNFAVPGIYFYDNDVVEIAKNIKPSHRGELEITDVNKEYLRQGKLKVSILDKGTAWLDTGTFTSLMQASQFVQVIEERQGLKIGAIEEAAYRQGFISKDELKTLATPLLKSGYGKHLISIIED